MHKKYKTRCTNYQSPIYLTEDLILPFKFSSPDIKRSKKNLGILGAEETKESFNTNQNCFD